jgi:hypothetical protein
MMTAQRLLSEHERTRNLKVCVCIYINIIYDDSLFSTMCNKNYFLGVYVCVSVFFLIVCVYVCDYVR